MLFLAELVAKSRAARIAVLVFFLIVLGAIGVVTYNAAGPATH